MLAKQRDEDLWAQFALDVIMYTPEMLVFLDETGSDRCNSLRKYGYSLRGKPTVSKSFLLMENVYLQWLLCQCMECLTSRWCLEM